MKSVVLIPYCPWPPDTGTKVEMMKPLQVLRELGPCTIASARSRPVGAGWTEDSIRALRDQGFDLVFREETDRRHARQIPGMLFAVFCKALRMERAFGYGNPYHRYAFTEQWWRKVTEGADLAVMQYGFWARFRSACPQAVILHELLSNYQWGGSRRETRDLAKADLVVVVGYDEEATLRERGLRHVLWSPPAVPAASFEVTPEIGMISTLAPQNMEGLQWLQSTKNGAEAPFVHVYGSAAKVVSAPFLKPVGRYEDRFDPYRRCGIQLLTRDDRPGLQIKAVEALACGRAIVARRGSMRGLPAGDGAWIEVTSPEEMLVAAKRLRENAEERETLGRAANAFYERHLDEQRILDHLKKAFQGLVKNPKH